MNEASEIMGKADLKHAKREAHYWAYVTTGSRWLRALAEEEAFQLLHFLGRQSHGGEYGSQLGTDAKEGTEGLVRACRDG